MRAVTRLREKGWSVHWPIDSGKIKRKTQPLKNVFLLVVFLIFFVLFFISYFHIVFGMSGKGRKKREKKRKESTKNGGNGWAVK